MPALIESLRQLDESILWDKFPYEAVSEEPYGIIPTEEGPTVRWPKDADNLYLFLENFDLTQHLLCTPKPADWVEILDRVEKEPVACDIETKLGLGKIFSPDNRVICFSLAFEDGTSYSFPIHHYPFVTEQQARFNEKLMLRVLKAAKFMVFQYGFFDIIFLCHRYPQLNIFKLNFKFDTLVAAHIATGAGLDAYNLGYLSTFFLKAPSWKEGPMEWLAKNCKPADRTFDKVPPHILWPYARRDSYYTIMLYTHLNRMIILGHMEEMFDKAMNRINRVCLEMSSTGFHSDKFLIDHLENQYLMLSEEAENKLKKILSDRLGEDLSYVNISSPQQMSMILYDILGLPVLGRTAKKKTPKTGTKETLKLAPFDPPIFSALFTSKKWARYNGYLKNYVKFSGQRFGEPESQDSYVCHPSFSVTGTDTGRLSSSKPNAQNLAVSSGLKTVFCCPDRASHINDIYVELSKRGMPTGMAANSFFGGDDEDEGDDDE